MCVFFFKHKTTYEMRISDWSSDVCSSDLVCRQVFRKPQALMRRSAAAGYQGRILLEQGACAYDESSDDRRSGDRGQIGRASCRERVCQNVYISVVAVPVKKQSPLICN